MQQILKTLDDGSIVEAYVMLSQPGKVGINFADSSSLDSFGRLRVSTPTTIFDSQQEYGLDTLRIWDCSANGTAATASSDGSATSGSNAVGPRNATTRLTPITVSTTSGHYSILQSRQYVRYIPAKSHLVFMTGVFASGSGYSANISIRSSASGDVVDNTIAQTDWNIDKFDGAGPSKAVLDLTKTQILFIQAQWLGVGRVIVGFDIDGQLYPAHAFNNANLLTVPYTQSFNLPVRLEIRNSSSSSSIARVGYFDANNGVFLSTSREVAGGTISFCCCSVQSEGGTDVRGFPNSSPAGISTIAVTTRRPILSIRPKATYNSLVNRAHIKDLEYITRTTGNDSLIEIIIGGTLTGASFQSVSANSCAEYDVSATAISGGESIVKAFSTAGAGASSVQSGGGVDIRSPLVLSKIDSLAENQIPITIVATSFSGTSNVTSLMNWHEQII